MVAGLKRQLGELPNLPQHLVIGPRRGARIGQVGQQRERRLQLLLGDPRLLGARLHLHAQLLHPG